MPRSAPNCAVQCSGGGTGCSLITLMPPANTTNTYAHQVLWNKEERGGGVPSSRPPCVYACVACGFPACVCDTVRTKAGGDAGVGLGGEVVGVAGAGVRDAGWGFGGGGREPRQVAMEEGGGPRAKAAPRRGRWKGGVSGAEGFSARQGVGGARAGPRAKCLCVRRTQRRRIAHDPRQWAGRAA